MASLRTSGSSRRSVYGLRCVDGGNAWLRACGTLHIVEPAAIQGIVRRVRRVAALSHRDLAARIGVSPATIARIERVDGAITLALRDSILAVAGFRLLVLDTGGAEVEPMRSDGARDRRGAQCPVRRKVATVGRTRRGLRRVDSDGSRGFCSDLGCEIDISGRCSRRSSADGLVCRSYYSRRS